MSGVFNDQSVLTIERGANWVYSDVPFWKLHISMSNKTMGRCTYHPFGKGALHGKVYAIRITNEGKSLACMFNIIRPFPNKDDPVHEIRGTLTISYNNSSSTFGLKKNNFWVDLKTNYQIRPISNSKSFFTGNYHANNKANCQSIGKEMAGNEFEFRLESLNISKSIAGVSSGIFQIRNLHTKVIQTYQVILTGLTYGAGTPSYTPGFWTKLPKLKQPISNWSGTKIHIKTGMGVVVVRAFDKTTITTPKNEILVSKSWLAMELGGYVTMGSVVQGTLK